MIVGFLQMVDFLFDAVFIQKLVLVQEGCARVNCQEVPAIPQSLANDQFRWTSAGEAGLTCINWSSNAEFALLHLIEVHDFLLQLGVHIDAWRLEQVRFTRGEGGGGCESARCVLRCFP